MEALLNRPHGDQSNGHPLILHEIANPSAYPTPAYPSPASQPQQRRESTAGSSTSGSDAYTLPNGVPASMGSQDFASTRAHKGSSVGSAGSQSLGEAIFSGQHHLLLL